jgi:peptidyl-prolyl cis-trans isomerase B (cyclophilin B)
LCPLAFSPRTDNRHLTLPDCRWLDGRHVVFGEILEGYEIVEKIEQAETAPGDKPKLTIKIAKSGELEVPPEGIHVEL